MGRKGLELVDVENAIKKLRKEGREITTRAIRDITQTGSYLTITKYRKEIEKTENKSDKEEVGNLKKELSELKFFLIGEIENLKKQNQQKERKKDIIENTLLKEIIIEIIGNDKLPKKEQIPNTEIAKKYKVSARDIGAVKKLLTKK